MGEENGLELGLDRFRGEVFSRPEVAAARVVDHDIEVAGFTKGLTKTFAYRDVVAQIKPDGMEPRQLWNPAGIARCAPDLVAAFGEQSCGGETDARTRAGEED